MLLKNISLVLLLILTVNFVSAQKYLSKEMPEITSQWNENTFNSTKSFAENIQDAPEFTTLGKILKNGFLSEEIEKNEMVTIFAFTNEAFDKLEKKERDSIMGNPKLLVSMVKHLIVPGRIDRHGLVTEAKKHNGTFQLSTLSGENLMVNEKEGKLYLTDAEGRRADIIATDFYHKNGFFHIINGAIFQNAK